MQQVVTSAGVIPKGRWVKVTSRARLEAPTRIEWLLAAISTSLLIFSFPNFDSYLLAWIGLVPLLVAIGRRPAPLRALILGWATGTVFFYVTCYWLTHSMIHYGGLPTVLAYLLLIPGAVVIGFFPGLFAVFLALAIRRWGQAALLFAPLFWTALEWIRLGVTGQLWNAMGYSQAFNSFLIQAASVGGVYAVSFLILAINAAVALLIVKRTMWTIAAALTTVLFVIIVLGAGAMPSGAFYAPDTFVSVIAVQPNVPMNPVKSVAETKELIERHLALSKQGLAQVPAGSQRLVVWPESPMNFTYTADRSLQELVANFTKENRTMLLFNSLEPAPNGGSYNSALLINEEGRLISQYDKIRLMPFGEYVPLPQWLPGASLISGIVGEFTPGSNYTLMPVGDRRAGVFICIEAAYPWIARRLANEGADTLINISNDGYLGPTAVMRQHLANAIFRAVETNTPMLRVTNTGLSAEIADDGRVVNLTRGFQPDVRVWSVWQYRSGKTFYTRYGDLFVQICAAITFVCLIANLLGKRKAATDLAD